MQKVLLKLDTASTVRIRHLDPQKLKSYAEERDFKYDVAPFDTNWWGRFWRWFWNLLEDAFNNGPSGQFWGYLALAILVAFALYIILKAMGVDLKIFSGRSKVVEIPFLEVEDNIHDIDFTQEIEKAIAANNFHWQPDKTNQAYISEIADASRKHTFKRLTDQFEYVWYGEFAINKQQFDQMKAGFENFKPKSV
jgi:hypothetical protein